MRYAWPSEIDLMARLAGLSLAERWGGWDRRAFDAGSTMHVSIFRKGRCADLGCERDHRCAANSARTASLTAGMRAG